MSDPGQLNRLSRTAGARHFKSGALGFVIGVSLASFLAVRIVDKTRKEMDWADSVSDLSRSVRTLETHVKDLERNSSNGKP
ncbi:LANO_0H11914g1_1 [Lachancea nothofagi CBS 11611]|uniref:LANO_0H11914g1_1 n=1 Tax=Lachancea nothofagi CBS 11611 TaxID=1266666 RepID=A0A1G4KM83_9SACH|nr:LANO_0H11914g1_1 [Lachancea nothofagi CBS 11611]